VFVCSSISNWTENIECKERIKLPDGRIILLFDIQLQTYKEIEYKFKVYYPTIDEKNVKWANDRTKEKIKEPGNHVAIW